MRGSLKQRSPGSWSLVLPLGKDPTTGKHRQKWVTFRGNKREAQAELTRLLNELHNGTLTEAPQKLTVSDLLDRWLRDYAKSRVSNSTYETYETLIRVHLKPGLGRILLTKLSPAQIQSFYTDRLERGRVDGTGGLSRRSVLHLHRVLSEALNQAVKWQWLARNPAAGAEPPTPTEKEMSTVDEDGSLRLLEEAADSWLYLPILLGLTLGVRRGEVLGLRWTDVDFDRGLVSIRRSLEQTRQGLHFKSPKNGEARVVAAPSYLLDELRRLKAEQAKLRLASGSAWQDHGLVVTLPDGSPRKPDNLTHAFLRLRKRVGASVTFHGLRHSHATLLLERGVQPKVVSERLGHSSIKITQDLYAHVMPHMQEAAAQEVDTAFRSALQKRQKPELRIA